MFFENLSLKVVRLIIMVNGKRVTFWFVPFACFMAWTGRDGVRTFPTPSRVLVPQQELILDWQPAEVIYSSSRDPLEMRRKAREHALDWVLDLSSTFEEPENPETAPVLHGQ
jgi:hypothetical protein